MLHSTYTVVILKMNFNSIFMVAIGKFLILMMVYLKYNINIGCQLDEPNGFNGDHHQNVAMFQCYVHFLYLQSVLCSCIIVVFFRK